MCYQKKLIHQCLVILKQLEGPWMAPKSFQQKRQTTAWEAHHQAGREPDVAITEEALNAAIEEMMSTADAPGPGAYAHLRRRLAERRAGLPGDLPPFWKALMLALAEKRWLISPEMEANLSEATLHLLAEHTLLMAAVKGGHQAVPEQLAVRLPCREITRPLLRRLFRQMPPVQRHRVLAERWAWQIHQPNQSDKSNQSNQFHQASNQSHCTSNQPNQACQESNKLRQPYQASNRCQERELLFLLHLEGAHPPRAVSAEMVEEWWEIGTASEKCLRALLQCAEGKPVHEKQVLEKLEAMDFFQCTARLQQAMINYCATAAGAVAGQLLTAWREKLTPTMPVENWVREYLALGEGCWRRRQAKDPLQAAKTLETSGALEPAEAADPAEPAELAESGEAAKQDKPAKTAETAQVTSEKRKLTLAQFMFYGDLLMPGKANSGGISTLLHSLGDTLAQQPEVEQVYTFMMIPCDQRAATISLITPLAPGHTLVRVPVFFNETCSPRLFGEKEDDLFHTLNQMMTLLAIDPDLYHMRYSDNASLAAVLLAVHRGKKPVFTLTPDPHRHLMPLQPLQPPLFQPPLQSPLQSVLQERGAGEQDHQVMELLEKLNKVAVADEIISQAQGIVGIGTEVMAPQLLHHFPQLEQLLEGTISPLMPEQPVAWQQGHQSVIQQKALAHQPVFQMIPEGIWLNEARAGSENQPGNPPITEMQPKTHDPREAFAQGSLVHHLSPERLTLPLILTVGRLDPVKGHENLLKAWGATALWRHMNLVFIGGDHQWPDEKERQLMGAFSDFMAQHPQLQGGFCHLPRMDNVPLRQLQCRLATTVAVKEGPAVIYVAPSLKEEFGLSIIEAMAAGLPVIAPQAGGVSSYITHGVNGFLMETTSAATIGRELSQLLLENPLTPSQWQALASRGKTTVAQRFDIRQVARRFTDFYQQVAAQPE